MPNNRRAGWGRLPGLLTTTLLALAAILTPVKAATVVLAAAPTQATVAHAASPLAMGGGPSSPYASAVLANRPLVYLRLNETSGTTAADSSGNGHNGTYQGAQLGVAGPLSDESSAGISGSGYNSTVLTQSGEYLPAGNAARTMELWLQSGHGYLFIGYGDFTMTVNTYNSDSISIAGGSVQVPQLLDGKWHHVAAAWDGSHISLYADGQSLGVTTPSAGLSTTEPGSPPHLHR